jgi:2-polyprenyl-6-methoxyphenol hydroxylase-like FAD-dependent oxidoreductase
MHSDPTVDVLVVGAGPVGLVLASELTRHGASVRVIEKRAERPRLSKGLTVHSRSLETFDILGLADDLVADGFESRGLNLSSDSGSPAFISMEYLPGRYRCILILPQWRTEEIIEAHLAEQGVTVERRLEFLDFTQQRDSVEATVRNADGKVEKIRARYLAGCDGAHSVVREKAGIEFAGKPYPWAAQVMDINLETEQPIDVLENYTTRRGFVMFMPFADGSHRVITMDHASNQEPHAPTVAENQELIDSVVDVKAIKLVGDPKWTSHLGVLQHRQATEYRCGRVFLAGDAAHINFPTGGQGMNAGINDSVNLAWKLALDLRGASDPQLLDTYQEERYPVGKMVGKLTHKMSKLYTVRNPVGLFIRKRFLRVVAHKQALQRKIAFGLSGHAVSYAEGKRAKSLEAATPDGARGPGAAAPDVTFVAPGGEPTRLYELLRQPFFHLFLLVGNDAESNGAAVRKVVDGVRSEYGNLVNVHVVVSGSTAATALSDPKGEMVAKYGSTAPAAILIRPDGYVGAHSAGLELGQVLAGIRTWVAQGVVADSPNGVVA